MAEKISLQKSYSALNERLAHQFDASGVRRSFTVPYISGQKMHEHIQIVGQAAAQAGGLTANLLTTHHTADGKGYGSSDGSTVGHPSDKLRTTIIPKDDEKAKATIAAAQKHLDNVAKLVGDDNPAVVTANSQLKLVKKSDGAGMNLLDFGVMMTQLMYRPNQAVAQAHDQTKPGGLHPKLRGPVSPASQDDQEPQESAQGGAQSDEGGPEGQEPDQTAQAAPAGQQPAPVSPPTAPAAQQA